MKSAISRIAVQIDAGAVRLAGEFAEQVRSGKDLVRVSEHALPAEVAELVHDFGRTGSAVGQIAAVKRHIGSHIPNILQNRFETPFVPVDVGQDRNTQSADDSALLSAPITPNRREPGFRAGATLTAVSFCTSMRML